MNIDEYTKEEIEAKHMNSKVIADPIDGLRLRNIIVTGSVDEEMSSQICKNLLILNAEDFETPIAMHINTYGGSVYDMLAIYDVMKFINAPIYTIGFGKVMSAGMLVLAAGEPGHRYCLPNTTLMIHKSHGGASGAVEDIESSMKHIQYLQSNMEELLMGCTSINKKQMKEFMSGADTYLKPNDALDLGIVDKISGVMPRIMY